MISTQLASEIQSKEVLCPVCSGKLECFYQKRSTIKGLEGEIIHGPGIFRLYHPKPSCLLRFQTFGEGPTEEEAIEQARTAVSNYHDQNTDTR